MDRYTRVVLSVIAACLLWICARDIVPWRSAEAAPAQAAPVRIVGVECSVPVTNPTERGYRITKRIPLWVTGR